MEDHQLRNKIPVGGIVLVAVKINGQYQKELHQGIVRDILTNSKKHYRGIKVRLLDGTVGRVQKIVGEMPSLTEIENLRKENAQLKEKISSMFTREQMQYAIEMATRDTLKGYTDNNVSDYF